MIYRRFHSLGLIVAAVLIQPAHGVPQNAEQAAACATSTIVTYYRADIDGVKVFYREAGPQTRPPSCCCMGFRPCPTCSAN